MGIFVFRAAAQTFVSGVVRIPQMDRHGAETALFRICDGLIQRHDDRVGFRAFADRDDRLCHRQPRFRQADGFQRLRRGDGLQHGRRVCQTHVLAGMRNDSPRDQPRIDARIQQPREPRHGRVRVAAAQTFAERREHVVIQRFIAADDRFLDGFFGDLHGYVNHAVLIRFGCQHGQLQRAQCRTHVAVGNPGNVAHRVVVHLHAHAAETALFVGKRAAHGEHHVRFAERIELENPASAHDGRGHGHERVFRRRADEAHHAALDGGKDAVALRFAPSVAFVQQQVCRLPVQAAPVLRFLDDLSHIRHAAGYGVKLHKSGMRRIGDDGGERRFAAPRRAVEDGGSHAVGLDGAAEQPPRPNDVPLPDKFVQRSRTHAVSQRAESGFFG